MTGRIADMWSRYRRLLYLAIVAPFAGFAIIGAIAIVKIATDAPSCESETTAKALVLSSPDGAWEADIDEESCAARDKAAPIAESFVALRRPGQATTRGVGVQPGDVFSAYKSRPVLRWLSPLHLEVTVPTRTFVVLYQTQYQGIEVSVNFARDEIAEPSLQGEPAEK